MKDETLIYIVFTSFVIIWHIVNNITLYNIISTLAK